jgi:hypothetical protein
MLPTWKSETEIPDRQISRISNSSISTLIDDELVISLKHESAFNFDIDFQN